MSAFARFVLALLLVSSTAWNAAAQTPTGKSGFRTGWVTYQRSNGRVVARALAVWYPTKSKPGSFKYPYVQGRVAKNAAIAPGRWPLIVHSHGVGECGLASSYLNEGFAEAGYIVAAVDHDDASNCTITGGTLPLKPWNPLLPNEWNFPFRTSDIAAVLDTMLSSPTWAGAVDSARIAASGHSLGGWTVSALSDARIGSRLLWSPSYELAARFYGGITGPTAYLFDQYSSGYSSPFYRTWAYDNTPGPKVLGYLQDTAHYVFTDKTCALALTTSACRGSGAPRTIVTTSRAFLDYYTRGEPQAFVPLLLPPAGYLEWQWQP